MKNEQISVISRRKSGLSFLLLLLPGIFLWQGCLKGAVLPLAAGRQTVYLAGSAYGSQEKLHLERMAAYLEDAGFDVYLPHRKGIWPLLEAWMQDSRLEPETCCRVYAALQKAVFCHEMYRLIQKADFLVFNMNGRVPDEGGTFLTAVAFSAGIPLAIYQNDHRTIFHGNNNTMLDGCAFDFRTVSSVSRLPAALQKSRRHHLGLGTEKIQVGQLPPYVREAVNTGREIAVFLESRPDLPAASAADAEKLLKDLQGIVAQNPFFAGNAVSEQAASPPNGHTPDPFVYCSGGLFSPEELADMQAVADMFEKSGFGTYLPHRDGVEAFVMNQVNSPIANSIWLKPFRVSVNRQIFALDIYQIIEKCDYFVFNMNGRVPDEGGVVELAVAMMHGKPVVIYKQDPRSFMAGGSHPLLLGAGGDFRVEESVDRLPEALRQKARLFPFAPQAPAGGIRPNVMEVVKYGRKVQKRIDRLGWARPSNKMTAETPASVFP